MEQLPEPSYEEKDWQALQSRLGQEDKKRRPAAIALWWLALPLLLLSASNVLFFKELKIAKQQIALLETRHDTVFVERVIVRTDTIYQTRTLRETVVECMPAKYAEQPGTAFQNAVPPLFAQREEAATGIVFFEKNMPAAALLPPTPLGLSDANLEKIKYPDPALLDLPPSGFGEIGAPHFVFNKKKTLRYHLYALRPKDFSLVAIGGWLRPLGKGVVKGTGYSLGLEGRAGFSPRLALWLHAIYGEATVEADKMDESLGIPAVQPPSGEFSFAGAEAKQRTWQYAAGMQFALLDRNGWKLWAGAGYGAVQVLPYHATYDFVNAAGLESSDDGETLRFGLIDDYLLLRVGFERKLAGSLSAQFAADWRSHLGGEVLRPADLLRIGAGLVYRF